MEDDVIIPVKYKKKVNTFIYKTPKDWDILFLGGSRVYGKKINNNVVKPYVVNDWMNCGLFAYIIKKSSIEKLLKYTTPIHTYIDMQINQFYSKVINAYYSYPHIVKHNYDGHSTRDNNKNKYSDDFIKKSNQFYLF